MSNVKRVYGPDMIEAFSLRIPMSLRKRVMASAQQERRSINGQIIYLLDQALPAETNAVIEAGTPITAE